MRRRLKAVMVNGALSSNPPPTPFLYEYAYGTDNLKTRFIFSALPATVGTVPLTTSPTLFAVPTVGCPQPFTPALDVDASGNNIKVILCDVNQAEMVYTADISQQPDLWDIQLHAAIVSTLAAYLVNPLARNSELLKDQVTVASSAISAARATDGNEALISQDHVPDWISVRYRGGTSVGVTGNYFAPWDVAVFPGGMIF